MSCGMKEKLEQTRLEKRAERAADLEKAARLRYGEQRQLEEQIRAAEERLKSMQSENALLKEEVDAEEIAAIVGRWTGSPSQDCSKARLKSSCAWNRVCTSVVGQDDAVRVVSNAVRRARAAGSQPPDRVVHLLGPTGVGKTELAPWQSSSSTTNMP